MAGAKIWLGFGGVEFDDGASVATFSGGSGLPTYTPDQIIRTGVNHNIISRNFGFHVTIAIKELLNINETDYIQFQRLARILGGLVSSASQRTVTITPRDDTSLTNNISYECILTSPVSPQDLDRLKIGQSLALSFMCVNLKDTIPTIVSDTTSSYLVDESANYLVDESGNYLSDGLG